MTRFLPLATALAFVAAQPAIADQSGVNPTVAAGVKFGAQGVTVQLRSRVSESWFARGNYSFLNANVELEGEDGGLDYVASVRARTFGILADYHPWGSFRFTAGVNFTDVTGEGTGNCTELFCTVGDRTFTPLQLGTLNIDYDVGPQAYVAAIGVTTNRNELGWGFDAELGVQWRPDVDVELRSTGGTCQIDPLCQAQQQKDEEQYEELLEFLPVVNIGLFYAF